MAVVILRSHLPVHTAPELYDSFNCCFTSTGMAGEPTGTSRHFFCYWHNSSPSGRFVSASVWEFPMSPLWETIKTIRPDRSLNATSNVQRRPHGRDLSTTDWDQRSVGPSCQAVLVRPSQYVTVTSLRACRNGYSYPVLPGLRLSRWSVA